MYKQDLENKIRKVEDEIKELEQKRDELVSDYNRIYRRLVPAINSGLRKEFDLAFDTLKHNFLPVIEIKEEVTNIYKYEE